MKKQNFANNLKNLREQNNITQSKLAKILGITRQAVYAYEIGKATPSLDILEQLTEIFNCTLDSLVFSETVLNISKFSNINSLLNENYTEFNALSVLNSTKKKLLLKKQLIDDALNDIESAIIKINSNSENISNTLNSTLTEYSNELSPFINSNTINFYKNTKIIRASNYNNIENHDDFFKIPFIGQVSAGYPAYAYEDIEKYFYIPKEYRKYNEDDYFILRIKGESMNKIYKNGDYVLVRKTCCIDENKPSVVLVNNEEATVKYVMLDDEYFYLQPYSDSPKYQENMSYKKNENKLNIIGTVIGVVFEKEE